MLVIRGEIERQLQQAAGLAALRQRHAVDDDEIRPGFDVVDEPAQVVVAPFDRHLAAHAAKRSAGVHLGIAICGAAARDGCSSASAAAAGMCEIASLAELVKHGSILKTRKRRARAGFCPAQAAYRLIFPLGGGQRGGGGLLALCSRCGPGPRRVDHADEQHGVERQPCCNRDDESPLLVKRALQRNHFAEDTVLQWLSAWRRPGWTRRASARRKRPGAPRGFSMNLAISSGRRPTHAYGDRRLAFASVTGRSDVTRTSSGSVVSVRFSRSVQERQPLADERVRRRRGAGHLLRIFELSPRRTVLACTGIARARLRGGPAVRIGLPAREDDDCARLEMVSATTTMPARPRTRVDAAFVVQKGRGRRLVTKHVTLCRPLAHHQPHQRRERVQELGAGRDAVGEIGGLPRIHLIDARGQPPLEPRGAE